MSKDLFKPGEDTRLVLAVQAGDQQCFSLLYDKYAPALLGIISKIIDNEHLAENTLQLTFVNAWNTITRFNSSDCSLFTWLINMARKTAFEKLPSKPAGNLQDSNTVYEAANRGISNLETDAIVFEMVYNKRLSCIEVATLLDMSVDEIKTNIKKAVQRLRENIVAC